MHWVGPPKEWCNDETPRVTRHDCPQGMRMLCPISARFSFFQSEIVIATMKPYYSFGFHIYATSKTHTLS